MPTPNVFAQAFNLASALLLQNNFETRSEPDGNGNPVYIAFSPIPGADPALPIWMIYKFYYDGSGNFLRRQLPAAGEKYTYIYNSRATYF